MAPPNVAKNLQFEKWLVNTEPEVLENCLIKFQETLGYPDKENFKRTLERLSRLTYVKLTQMSVLASSSIKKNGRIGGSKLPEESNCHKKDHRQKKMCNTSELNNNELAAERKKKQYAALRKRRLLKKDRLHKKMIDLFGSTSPTPPIEDLKKQCRRYESQLLVNTSGLKDDNFELPLEAAAAPTLLAEENISKISYVINNDASRYANDITDKETHQRSTDENHITPSTRLGKTTQQQLQEPSVEKIYEISKKASDNLTSEVIFESDDESEDVREKQEELTFTVIENNILCTTDAKNKTSEICESNQSTNCPENTVKFPRIKVTSHREVKKFPGKMESMKKTQSEIKIAYPRMKITNHRQVKKFPGKMESMRKTQLEDKTYPKIKVLGHRPLEKYPGQKDAMTDCARTTNSVEKENQNRKTPALAVSNSDLWHTQETANKSIENEIKNISVILKSLLDTMYGDYEMCKPHVSSDKLNTQVVKIIACRTILGYNKQKNCDPILMHLQDTDIICQLKKSLLESFETMHPLFDVFFDETIEVFRLLIRQNSGAKPEQEDYTKLNSITRNLNTTNTEIKSCDENDLHEELPIHNKLQGEIRCKNLKELLNTNAMKYYDTVNNQEESQLNKQNMFVNLNSSPDVSTEHSKIYNSPVTNKENENISIVNNNNNMYKSIKSTNNEDCFQNKFINFTQNKKEERTQYVTSMPRTTNQSTPNQQNSSVIQFSGTRGPSTVSQSNCEENTNHLVQNFNNVRRNNTIDMVKPAQTIATNALNENSCKLNVGQGQSMQRDLISSTGTVANWASITPKQPESFLREHTAQERSSSLTYPIIAPSNVQRSSKTSVPADKGCSSSNTQMSRADVRCAINSQVAANPYCSKNPCSASSFVNNMSNQQSKRTYDKVFQYSNTQQPTRENFNQNCVRNQPEKSPYTSVQQVTEAQHVNKRQCSKFNQNNNQSAAYQTQSQSQPGNVLPSRDNRVINQGQHSNGPSFYTNPLAVANQTQPMLNASYLPFSQTNQVGFANYVNQYMVSGQIPQNPFNLQPNIPVPALNQSYHQSYQANLQHPMFPSSSSHESALKTLLLYSANNENQSQEYSGANKSNHNTLNANSRMDQQATSSSSQARSNPPPYANYFHIQQSSSQNIFLTTGKTIEENVCYPNAQNTQPMRHATGDIALFGHDYSATSGNVYQNTNNTDTNAIQRQNSRETHPSFDCSRGNIPIPVKNTPPWHQEEQPRSSMSRDSGIFSPADIVENNATLPAPITGRDEMGDSSGIGVISFVTSENPAAQRTDRTSPCNHCGKHTVLKCMQCMSVYYCSSACQMAQWEYHGPICKSPLC